jgi:anti-anti-sigma factor
LVSAPHSGDSEPWAVVSVAGQAGIGDCASLRRLLELDAAQRPGRTVVGLSQLSSMDWWAALMLLWVGRVISRRGGTLALASPQSAVARLLASAGAEQVIPIYGTVQQAIGSLAADGDTAG